MEEEKKLSYTEQIKELRARRGEGSKEKQERSKEQIKAQKAILAAIDKEAKTVPEIAEATGMNTQEVFWWITAMRKYNKVTDETKKGDYIAYRKK